MGADEVLPEGNHPARPWDTGSGPPRCHRLRRGSPTRLERGAAMKFAAAISASVLAGGLTVFAPAGWAQSGIPMDTPTTMGGIETVCTGVGEQAQNPRWLAYPVRIDFSNGGAQFLSGAHVELTTAGGKPILSLDCDA